MALAVREYSEWYVEPQAIGVASLRGWLHGSWGLLFSHADDFASYGFEADRWLVHVQDAFESTAVRPIALMSCAEDESDEELPRTWIGEMEGGALAVRRSDARRLSVRLQKRERTLFTAIVSATTRFVMIVDEALHLRRTFAYSPGDQLPSPIELATMAARLRTAEIEGGERKVCYMRHENEESWRNT
jgi:hypothetical protein